MIYIGSFSARNKAISVKNQREIVKWVIGTHQTLIQYYPQIAEFRQKHWMSWIDSDDAANVYQKEHLPHIAIKYASIWDVKFDPTTNISPSVLDQIKGEIIDLLVWMYVLPRSYLGTLAVRRSRRNAAVSDDDSEHEIEPWIHKRQRNERSRVTYLDPDGVDNDVVDVADPNSDVKALFNLGAIKSIWQDGDYQEVGRLEIALLNAHAGTDVS